MFTIINEQGKVLYCRLDLPTVEGEIAIEQVFSGEIPEGKELYFNFDTNEFELR